MTNHPSNKVLIISWNTVPVEDKKIQISATGMRTYKLALGLLGNGYPSVDVAVKNYETSMGKSSHQKINIKKWETDDQVAQLANNYDVVIINSNYDVSTPYILDRINDSVVKIVDAFIPFYFEESMRDDTDDAATQNHVHRLGFLHHSFLKADYILVANHSQKLMYLGAFGAVNLLNFDNFSKYEDNFIINFPGVIGEPIPRSNPYLKYKKLVAGRKIVVWFGSTYKWYDIDPLIAAYTTDSELTEKTILFVVGAKNPNFASRPVETEDKTNSIMFIPWVDYADRLTWLTNADIGVSLNKKTAENIFSFRNRLIDFIETDLPLITNGADPLGEKIIKAGGGVKAGAHNLAGQIMHSLVPATNQQLRKAVSQLKLDLDNTNCGQVLAKRAGIRNKKALNQDFIALPHSAASSNQIESLSTKQISKVMIKRLRSSARTRVRRNKSHEG